MQTLTPALKAFIASHTAEEAEKLLLAAARYPGIDIPFAVEQLTARRQVRDKLPAWHANLDIIYPSRLAAEQCSSETTARYKQHLLRGTSCCDLTGGLGADAFYFAAAIPEVTYIERNPEYCEAARHNFAVLHADNIRVRQADVRDIAAQLHAGTCYIDPARRSEGNKRLFALEDCEPDILQLKTTLLQRCERLIVKISPMADIAETLRLLPETREIHIVETRNECKELLFVLEQHPAPLPPGEVPLHAATLSPGTPPETFTFTLQEEREAPLETAERVGSYLYEPHAALLKSGAFKTLALRYGLRKLHRHSHLYTSDALRADFPGRKFRTEACLEFSGKLLKHISRDIPQANLTTRNFPLSVAELRRRSRIREGGDTYLFATTLANGQKAIILCHKA